MPFFDDSIVMESNETFIGREWVFQAIDDWLADPHGSQFFILSGSPGSGKTAIAKRLVQFGTNAARSDNAFHYLHSDFLSASHRCTIQHRPSLIPEEFALSVAEDLANRYPAYKKALLLDPFIHISIVQYDMKDTIAIGMQVDKLILGPIPPEDAFNRLVWEPLQVLISAESDQQIVILVDALDEALSYSDKKVTILSLISEIRFPANVRFIVTTRPDKDVLAILHRLNTTELVLTSGEGLRQSLEDVRQYVQDVIEKESAFEGKFISDLTLPAFVDRIQMQSHGNFLYVKNLLNMLKDQPQIITTASLKGLPAKLDDIYDEFLGRRLQQYYKRDWRADYAPILGALAVAQVALTEAQLAGIIGKGQGDTRSLVQELRPFLTFDETLPITQQRYTIYHLSLANWLLDENRSKDYWCTETEEHQRLASWCEQGHQSTIWRNVDIKNYPVEQGRREYARYYFVTHLYQAKNWELLFKVLDAGAYGQAKLDFDPSTKSYAQDLDLGRNAVIEQEKAEEIKEETQKLNSLLRLWRYTLLRCSLTSNADAYPLETFQMLLSLESEKEVLGLADLLTGTAYQAQVLVQIAKYLLQQSHREEECLQILMKAHEIASIASPNLIQITTLVEIGEIFFLLRKTEKAEIAWATAESSLYSLDSFSNDHKEIAQKLGCAFILAGQWQRAETIVRTLDEVDREDVLMAVIATCIQTQQWDAARVFIQQIQESTFKAEALGKLGTALAQVGQEDSAEALCREAMIIMNEISQPFYRLRGLQELSNILKSAVYSQPIKIILNEIDKLTISLNIKEEEMYKIIENAESFMLDEIWEEAIELLLKVEKMIFPDKEPDWSSSALSRLGNNFSISLYFDYVRSILYKTNVITYKQYTTIKQKDEEKNLSYLLETKRWNDAKKMIDALDMQQASAKIWQLHEFGIALVQARLWKEVEAVADQIIDTGRFDWKRKIELLNKIGITAVQTQQLECVEMIIKKVKQCSYIERRNNYDDILNEMVKKLIQIKQWKYAEDVIENIWVKWTALYELKEALAKEKQWGDTQDILTRVENHGHETGEFNYEKREFDSSIITMKRFVELRQWNKAKDVAYKTKNIVWRADLLILLGELLAQVQQWQQAARILDKAEAIALTIKDGTEKSPLLLGLVRAFISIQQWEKALTLIITQNLSIYRSEKKDLITIITQKQQWKQVGNIIEMGKRYEVDNLGFFLLDLGEVLVQAQQWRLVEAVIELVEKGKKDNVKIILGELGKQLAQAQQWSLLEIAVEIIWKCQDDNDKIEILGELAIALLQVNQQEWAATLLTEAERIAIQERSRRFSDDTLDKGLPKLANMMIQAQQWEQARKIIEKRRPSILTHIKAELLIALGNALAQVKNSSGAEEAWEQAEKVIHSNPFVQEYIVVKILSALGVSFAQVQQWERADTLWSKAEMIALTIKDAQRKAWALEYLGEALVQMQQGERAEAVAGKIIKVEEKSKVLRLLGISLLQAGKWEQAQKVAETMILPELAKSFMQAGKWEQAEAVVQMLGEDHGKVELLQQIAEHLIQTDKREELFHFLQHTLLQAKTRSYCIELLSLSFELISRKPELAIVFCGLFTWVDEFLEGKDPSLLSTNFIK